MSSLREEVVQAVASRVPQAANGSVVRVAVDGVDGAGKSLFADELAVVLRAAGRPVVRASVDDFHWPRAERYRRGRDSPSGFWLDSFDYARLHHDLLDPLAPGEHPSMRRYVVAQRGYFQSCDPVHRADLVIDNNDWNAPSVRQVS